MENQLNRTQVGFIGVPSSAGARNQGIELCPGHLRRAGLPQTLQFDGLELRDFGDLPVVSYTPDPARPTQQNEQLVWSVLQEVEQAVGKALDQHAWPLVIGGDCTVTLGVLASMKQRGGRLGLVYMDGDLDLNTPATTASGILDGMVMAHVLGKARSAAANISSGAALVAEEDIVLFGYSTEAGWIETHELRQASAGRMIKFPLESLQSDIRGQARQAISQLENQVDRYLVHCDVDVVDSTDFDAADLPHSPGLTLEQTTVALEEFLSSSKAAGLVITEFNGRRDQDGVLASRLAETVMAAVRRLSK